MQITIHPHALARLRENRSLTVERFAQRAGLSLDEVRTLELEGGSITLTKANKLASALKLSWIALLDDNLEPERNFGTDNRSARNQSNENIDVDTQKVMEDVEYLLDIAEELNPEQGYAIPSIGTLRSSPEAQAAHFRTELQINTDEIKSLSGEYVVWNYWKDKVAQTGIYIIERSWSTRSVRAFSMTRRSKAAAVISTKEIPYARVFSLLHEVYHLLNKQSSICDLTFVGSSDAEADCNRFAASVMMPASEFRILAEEHHLQTSTNGQVDDDTAKIFQRHFKASRLSIYRRLQTLGYISQQAYMEVQNSYSSFERMRGSGGGNSEVYFRSRLNGVGTRLASELFSAYSSNKLTALGLARLMNVRVGQLPQIKNLMGGNGNSG